ncbi:MAG: hypothetical protein EX271_08665 [Acidimicrobiales bacterium]|nr:hypothetical protein [Hyphomonadaceae bacterium]RZV41122.1 MAG: hypothetical protein EX271_08665 [Acidimicrobiales bacterium]
MIKMKQPARAGGIADETKVSRRFAKYAQTRVSQHVADLQWQIKFTQMKLNQWPEQESCRWMNLVRMQEQAKRELSAVAH